MDLCHVCDREPATERGILCDGCRAGASRVPSALALTGWASKEAARAAVLGDEVGYRRWAGMVRTVAELVPQAV